MRLKMAAQRAMEFIVLVGIVVQNDVPVVGLTVTSSIPGMTRKVSLTCFKSPGFSFPAGIFDPYTTRYLVGDLQIHFGLCWPWSCNALEE